MNISLQHILCVILCLSVDIWLIERLPFRLIMSMVWLRLILTLAVSWILRVLEVRSAQRSGGNYILTFSCVLTPEVCVTQVVWRFISSFKIVLSLLVSVFCSRGISCKLGIDVSGILLSAGFALYRGWIGALVFSSLIDVMIVIAILGLTLSCVLLSGPLVCSIFLSRVGRHLWCYVLVSSFKGKRG